MATTPETMPETTTDRRGRPGGPVVTVTRRFDTSPERLFDAWLDADVARRWLFTMPDSESLHAEIDARVGGAFTFVDRRGDTEVTHHGTFLEIDRPRRLSFRFWVADEPKAVDRLTVEIAANGRGCVLTLTHALHPDWADYVDYTHTAWKAMFDELDDALAEAPKHELTIVRELDAPRELVFRMWAEPEHLRRWFGPKNFTIVDAGMEFRPGGPWHSHIRAASGGDHRMGGVYKEIRRPERIVFTHAWTDADGEPGLETLVTVTFEDIGGRTRLTFHQAAFETMSARDSHEDGWCECLDRLTAHLRACAPV